MRTTGSCSHFTQILEFVDDARTFARAAQVSRRWRDIVSDDQAWKSLCEKHAVRRMSCDSIGSSFNTSGVSRSQSLYGYIRSSSPSRGLENMSAIDENSSDRMAELQALAAGTGRISRRQRSRHTHRSRFKHAYLVESAWKKGGTMTPRHITPDQGVVTSLHLTKKYIIVGLDNSKIHLFNTRGDHQKTLSDQRTLSGHVMGVWALVPWDDTLVSGGCDRDVRVWNMVTG